MESQVRKLRKKLRQIENLEKLDRQLTYEENAKVATKSTVRSQLQQELISSNSNELNVFSQTFSSKGINKIKKKVIEEEIDIYDVNNDSEPINLNDQLKENIPLIIDKFNELEINEEKSKDYNDYLDDIYISNNLSVENKFSEFNVVSSNEKENLNVDSLKTNTKRIETKLNEKTNVIKEKIKLKECNNTLLSKKFSFIDIENGDNNDWVTCMDMLDNLLLTGSQDTTIKLWNSLTGKEIRTLSGHTETLSSVKILNEEYSNKFLEKFRDLEYLPISSEEVNCDNLVAVSSGLDCNLKIWNLNTGMNLRSIYTFNPITCFAIFMKKFYLVLGTRGGKLELWNLLMDFNSPVAAYSQIVIQDSITSISIDEVNLKVYCCGIDGRVKMFKINEDFNKLEGQANNETSLNFSEHKKIHTSIFHKNLLYFGDGNANLKVVCINKGLIRKLKNHIFNFGETNSILLTTSYILSSGYDLDSGIGYINLRSSGNEVYLGSLYNESTTRINCMSCQESINGALTVAVGGKKVQIWREIFLNQKENNLMKDHTSYISPVFIKAFSEPACDSEDENNFEDENFSDEETTNNYFKNDYSERHIKNNNNNKWFSWCSIS